MFGQLNQKHAKLFNCMLYLATQTYRYYCHQINTQIDNKLYLYGNFMTQNITIQGKYISTVMPIIELMQ